MAEDSNFSKKPDFLKGWSARLKKNYTLLAMVPQFPPFIYVENNRVVSKIGNLASFQSAIPPSIDLRVRPYNGYTLGTMSANGSYTGMLGYLQRKEIDLIEYPIPYDISNPPGILTTILVESGTNFLSIIPFPKKRASDLTAAFTSLGVYSLVLALIFYVVLVFQLSFLAGQQRIADSATFIFRILVKEHHIPMLWSRTLKYQSYRLILAFTLIYHFLLTILIETTIGTNLVVLEHPSLIDSIDDMYRSERVPIFIENHYSHDFFRYDRGNYKVRAIYERAKTCDTCFRKSESLLGSMSVGGDSLARPDYWSFFNEEMLIDGSKKGLCMNHFRRINKFGVVRISPFITKTLLAGLISEDVPKEIRALTNKGLRHAFEIGLFSQAISQMKSSFYGMQTPDEPEFHICRMNNDLNVLDGKYSKIMFGNVSLLSMAMVCTYVFSAFLLLVDWVRFLKNRILPVLPKTVSEVQSNQEPNQELDS